MPLHFPDLYLGKNKLTKEGQLNYMWLCLQSFRKLPALHFCICNE